MIEQQLACPDGLVYDSALHSYLLDGSPVPGVSTLTQIVAPDLYAGIAEDILMRAAARGRNRHNMVALDVRGDLDLTALPDDMLEDWSAWDEFRDLVNMEVEYSERCVASKRHKYAGTLDLAGVLTYKGKRGRWIIDLKYTAQMPALVAVQLAGYKQAASECLPGYEDAKRGCLWIKDGRYKLIEASNPMDLPVLIAGRSIHHWRLNK